MAGGCRTRPEKGQVPGRAHTWRPAGSSSPVPPRAPQPAGLPPAFPLRPRSAPTRRQGQPFNSQPPTPGLPRTSRPRTDSAPAPPLLPSGVSPTLLPRLRVRHSTGRAPRSLGTASLTRRGSAAPCHRSLCPSHPTACSSQHAFLAMSLLFPLIPCLLPPPTPAREHVRWQAAGGTQYALNECAGPVSGQPQSPSTSRRAQWLHYGYWSQSYQRWDPRVATPWSRPSLSLSYSTYLAGRASQDSSQAPGARWNFCLPHSSRRQEVGAGMSSSITPTSQLFLSFPRPRRAWVGVRSTLPQAPPSIAFPI